MELANGLVWSLLLLAVGVYCAVVGVLYLRRRQYVMGLLGIGCAIVIFTIPIQTHAVKIDLPINDQR